MASAVGVSRFLEQVVEARKKGAPWPPVFLAYSSTTAFAAGFLWIVSVKIEGLPVLFWAAAVVAIVASLAYLAVYSVARSELEVTKPSSNGVSERTRSAAMLGLFGATVSMVCLRMQWWVGAVPGLVVTLVGWAATVVFWLKDSWRAAA